ncbi:hypothetical protein PLICRDRAFT_38052 [Plicaturopsis crispa FD-325 SS-3]|nr:hypothetical protein PLICRDRAFT_38052 [Plicaturopsis crispa FD-325 SS-3]
MAPVATTPAPTVEDVTDTLKRNLKIVPATGPPAGQPDIQYHPDEENWKARTARRLAENPDLPNTPLPEGYPKKLESPLVWEGSDFKEGEKEWVTEFNEAQLKEIDDALKHFQSLNKPLGFIAKETFPLPTISPILHDLAKELHTGRGFFVVRTLPVDKYTREENMIVYAGIASHVGNLRGQQDQTAGVVVHISDLTKTNTDKRIPIPAYTTDKQVFHTDLGDFISLYALDIAAEGGTSRISSAWRVYNELAEKRPDLIKTLSEDWALDTFGGNPPYVLRAPLFYHDEKVIIQYTRRTFTGFLEIPRSVNIPPITEAQAEALDTIHFLATKYALGLNFKKGDIQFINNLALFHGRDGFRDDPEHPRHLLRLWLRNEELAWKLPEVVDPAWKRLYYTLKPEEQKLYLYPEVRSGAKYD